MKPVASLALALLLASASAQTSEPAPPTSASSTTAFTDPANLGGERVKPHDGRELPVDQSEAQGGHGLQQLLRKLNTRASILNIVAHPDDEDGGMLTLYSRGLGARVADLSLTRGEGGQNAATGDFEDALGLLRTQELLANDRYVGVDQMFGTEVDFGFSKTKAEAFAKWTHERVLYDVVRAIRIDRPLVLTATFIGGVTDGHGQHQVSGEIAQQAFLAAGDPTVFPELTREGILPWQPLKVYARVPMQSISRKGLFDYATGQYTPAQFTNYVTGEVTTTPPSVDVVVHEGTPDPLLADDSGNPRSYVQFARIGLGLQKSQIGGNVRLATSGVFDVAYHLYGSCLPDSPTARLCYRNNPTHTLSSRPKSAHIADAAESGVQRPASPYASAQQLASSSQDPNFFEGMDTSLLSLEDLAPDAFPTDTLSGVLRGINAATEQFDPASPEKIAPALAASLRALDELIPEIEKSTSPAIQKASALHELRIKRVQLNDALVLALGLSIDATAATADVLVKSAVPVHLSLTTSSPEPIALLTANIHSRDQLQILQKTPPGTITRDQPLQEDVTATPDITVNETRPYFYRDDIEDSTYKLHVPDLRNAPATPPALNVKMTLNYQGTTIELAHIVHAGTQPVSIVPPASIATLSHAQVFPRSSASIVVSLLVNPAGTLIDTDVPKDWKVVANVEPGNSPPGFKQFRLEPSTANRNAFTLAGIALLPDNLHITEGYRPVGYGDLPRTNYFTPATDRIVPVGLNFPAKKNIAYLPGTGDAVPEALASIGLTPTLLTVADLTASNLAQFDTVILGVRTYNALPELHGAPTQALLDYAKSGGNVVVQYQSMEFTSADAPYPLSLGSNEKVVDETAPVALLTPGNALPWTLGSGPWTLLSTPNRITPADFNGWIEERGHGFLSTWDPRYTALTETHDPGAPAEHVAPQAPQRGGLITAQVGKGRWTYVAFALYRQLPEAVPGAFRLFVNLLNP